jgi:O-antigen ligase
LRFVNCDGQPLNVETHFAPLTKVGKHTLQMIGVALLFVVGFVSIFLANESNRLELRGLQTISRVGLLQTIGLAAVGLIATLVLVRFAEIALAFFFLVGLVKGDPRLASAPLDLTLVIGAIVVLGVAYRMFRGHSLRLPREYFFYLPLLAMMILSLAYTPDLTAGIDKFLRFICLTSIGIISPFVLFDQESKVRRFFLTMAIGGLALAINSLTMLGGEERLVSPSGLNTELGAASAIALIVIWAMLFPRWPFLARVLLYPVLGVLIVALIGSGGRFANVSAVLCLVIGTLLYRKLFGDVLLMGALALVALPLIWIPQASFEYLHSLIHPAQAMGTRNDLMWLGVQMFSAHPLFGVGLEGFRFLSPNPLTYNYPHNLFLEIGSEMGILAAFAFLALAFCAFRESISQLRSKLDRANTLVPTVFLLLVYSFLDAMVSGDINDLRFMWFVFALPFVLRNLQSSTFLLKRVVDLPSAPQLAFEHATTPFSYNTRDI